MVMKIGNACAEVVSKGSDSMPVSPKLAYQAVLAKPPYLAYWKALCTTVLQSLGNVKNVNSEW